MVKFLKGHDRSSISGQATVEFGFTIVILLVLSLAAIEFTSLYVEKQKVSALSRECASISFRSCYDASGRPDIQACLDNAEHNEKVYLGATKILSNFSTNGKMIVSFYERVRPPNETNVYAKYEKGGGLYTGRYVSGTPFITSHIKREVICVGEVFYKHTPLTPFGTLLGVMIPEYTYEATIY